MRKLSFALIISSIAVHAVFAQGGFTSSWLIGLFVLLLLMMFAIFWLMKNQSPPMPYEEKKIELTSQHHYENEIKEKIQEMPPPKVHNEFYEVSSEHKPLPDDKMLMAQMKNKMELAKTHGLPKNQKPPKHIEQAVEEILQAEFEKRKPEFKGEHQAPSLLPKQEAVEYVPTKSNPHKPKPINHPALVYIKKKKSPKKKTPAKKKSTRKKTKSKKKSTKTKKISKPKKKSTRKKTIHSKTKSKKKSTKTKKISKPKKKSTRNKTKSKKKAPTKQKLSKIKKSTKKKSKKRR